MRLVALTGTIAAGKSTVAALLEKWGATRIDADQLVRQLQRRGEPVYQAIVARFGPGILRPDGELDRPALRRLILADAAARHDLEALVHPAVEQERRRLVEAASRRGDRLVIAEIPLLFESADPAAYQGIIVVDAPRALRRNRLVELRGLTPDEADHLLDAQLPGELKRARATWVIDNDGDLPALEARTRQVWQALAP